MNTQKIIKKKFLFKLHPKSKFKFTNTKNVNKIKNHKIKKDFSKIIISQTSSLIYDF